MKSEVKIKWLVILYKPFLKDLQQQEEPEGNKDHFGTLLVFVSGLYFEKISFPFPQAFKQYIVLKSLFPNLMISKRKK